MSFLKYQRPEQDRSSSRQLHSLRELLELRVGDVPAVSEVSADPRVRGSRGAPAPFSTSIVRSQKQKIEDAISKACACCRLLYGEKYPSYNSCHSALLAAFQTWLQKIGLGTSHENGMLQFVAALTIPGSLHRKTCASRPAGLPTGQQPFRVRSKSPYVVSVSFAAFSSSSSTQSFNTFP